MTDSTTDLIQELIAQRDDADRMGYGYYAEAFQKAITALSPVLPDATAVNTLGELQQEIERLQADNADKSQLLARFQGRIDEYEQLINQIIDDMSASEAISSLYIGKCKAELERIRGMK